jgi:cytoskeletal protein RodZ
MGTLILSLREPSTVNGFWHTACTLSADRLVSMEDPVKNRLHSFSYVANLGVVLGVLSFGGLLHAQQPSQDQQPTPQAQQAPADQSQQPSADQQQAQPNQTPSQTTPDSQSQPQSQTQQSSEAQTFTGTVVKQGDKYVLQDATSGTTYDIDHQDEVKKFDGKKVKVRGTLDDSGKMIKVQ